MKTVWWAACIAVVCACEADLRSDREPDDVDSSDASAPRTSRSPRDTAHREALPDTAATEHASAHAVQLRDAMRELLSGARPRETGEHTWFSSATADALRSVSADSAGHAIVDFDDLRALIPNASSSTGSAMLLEELNATVFGVAHIRSVDYRIEGSCERFWEWLQYSCQIVYRP